MYIGSITLSLSTFSFPVAILWPLFQLESASEPKERGRPPQPVNVNLYPPTVHPHCKCPAQLNLSAPFLYPITSNNERALDQDLVYKEPLIPTLNARLCLSLPSTVFPQCLTAVEVRCRIRPITALMSSSGGFHLLRYKHLGLA